MLFTGIFAKKNVFILEGAGTARIGDTVLQVEAGDFIAYSAGVRRMTFAIRDHPY